MKRELSVAGLIVIFAAFIFLSPGLLVAEPVTDSMVEEVANTVLTVQDEVQQKILMANF
jgi:hypothetical protein